jgi:phosphotransferase system  glucose/maltose/N-acetylglucosamine-specific IIC component
MGTRMSWVIIAITLILLAVGLAFMTAESKKDRYVDGIVVGVVAHDVMNSSIKVQGGGKTITLLIDDPNLPGFVQSKSWGPFRFVYRGVSFPGINNLRVVWYRLLPKWKGLE